MNIVILIVSIISGYCIYWRLIYKRRKEAQKIAINTIERAREKAEENSKNIKEFFALELEQKKKSSDIFLEEIEEGNKNLEKKLEHQEKDTQYLAQKLEVVEKSNKDKETLLENQENINSEVEKQIAELQEQIQNTLLKYSSSTLLEIEEKFINEFTCQLKTESQLSYELFIQNFNLSVERIAKRILSAAIHRCEFGHWSETHLSSIVVENQELVEKIQDESVLELFQEMLGVELQYEEAYNSFSIITGDGCSRETCKRVIEYLISTENFTLSHLKDIIEEIMQKLQKEIQEAGKETCNILEVDLPDEICALLGRLKYRTSFGQNVLWHSIEVAFLSSLIAEELGLDAKKAKKSGLLHDIGKALDHEQEGGHPEIGGEILEHFTDEPEVIEGVIGHHEDVQMHTPYATIINTADAISASRPGARRETFEKYIKRLEKLESIAYGVSGIENAFAISAGREIRVMVNPEKISDVEAEKVAAKIATSIEEELHYPGKIKITLIREMKVVEYAK